ncbi:hypothetical protein BU645_11795 [Staphylococcus chromogenes]|uniref:hypothetical protein n=1 Tax=Staphylococcus chromogenes TaxID=46126 RepID=UPI000D1BAAA5|nr:hypothetical protein [Staphylococcus chromogenes]PTG88114.1 hypothetical protein BU645_11795 [Staphylococcus chromogenes]
MELLASIIYVVCGIYIFKTAAFIVIPYVSEFYHQNQVSRSEDGNDFLSMMTTIIASFVITMFIGIVTYIIFRWFAVIVLVGLCIYIRVKDIG